MTTEREEIRGLFIVTGIDAYAARIGLFEPDEEATPDKATRCIVLDLDGLHCVTDTEHVPGQVRVAMRIDELMNLTKVLASAAAVHIRSEMEK